MLFNSFEFLIFFPVVVALYFILPARMRAFFLLAASCIFYMAFIPVYIFILLFTIGIDYAAGIWIENSEGKRKKLYLILSIFANVGVLSVFKYCNFFAENTMALAHLFHLNYSIPILKIILPVGLSFHTFQAMSYTIEVYRGNQKAEKNFITYALYVMFFPQLVAGPIERPQNLIHQFYEKHDFDYVRIADGLKLMVWGMFKKIVIADRLALIVSAVYSHPEGHSGFLLILATVFFAFQIYCDFSGYSDIAIGAAQVLGFRLMDNFNRPYHSKSIAEFWKRWHISLSSWFRDYLYIPLGGNKVSIQRWQFNLFFVFLISGFWHGASWTYILWGALNGFYLIFSIWTHLVRKKIVELTGLNRIPKVHQYLQIVVTFCLVNFAWIFFRAENVSDAFYIVTHLFSGLSSLSFAKIKSDLGSLGLIYFEILIAIVAIVFMEWIHFIQRHQSIRQMLSQRPLWFRWAVYYAMIFGITFLGVFSQAQFIYFQF